MSLTATTPQQARKINRLANTLALLLQDQIPGLGRGAVVTAQLFRQIKQILSKNLSLIVGGTFLTAGFLTLLPSLLVVAVNALGFTAGGVLKGSIAALIQQVIYAGATGGLYSTLQSFGALAVIGPPGLIAIGVTLGVVGVGLIGYQLWKWYDARRSIEDLKKD